MARTALKGGLLLRRDLVLGLSIPSITVSAMACSILGVDQDLPAAAAQEWFAAVVGNDFETASLRTCSALRGSLQVMEIWAAAEMEIATVLELRGDVGDADVEPKFNTVEREGAAVVVALSSNVPASNAQSAGYTQIDASWIMVLEDGKWRWCGSSPASAIASTPGSQIASEVEPSASPTMKPPAVTLTSTEAKPPEPTVSSQPKYPWEPCEDASASYLRVGDRAYVGYEPPLPNRVRDKPNWDSGSIIGRIYPGAEVKVIGGPTCNNEVVWWMVRADADGLVGWTVEGNQDDYWLLPLP